eukprot:gene21936-28982_t
MDPSLETLLRSCMSNDNAERSKVRRGAEKFVCQAGGNLTERSKAEDARKSVSAKPAECSKAEEALKKFVSQDGSDLPERSKAEEALKSLSAKTAVISQLYLPKLGGSASLSAKTAVISQLVQLLQQTRYGSETTGVSTAEKTPLVPPQVHHKVQFPASGAANAEKLHPVWEWPQLLHFLEQCSQSTESNHREVALTLFGSLAESIGDFLMPALMGITAVVQAALVDRRDFLMPALMGMIAVVQVALVDPSISVRRAALSAMEPLALLITEQQQIAGYHGLVAAMLQIILTLCEIPAPLLQPHLPSLVVFAVETACNVKLELETREQALQVLNWIARAPATKCGRRPWGADGSQDGGSGFGHTGVQLRFAARLPPDHHHASPAAVLTNPSERLAAMTVLAVASEGCAESMRKQLKLVLPMVLQGLQQSVRGAAAFAMGQFSEFLQPDIVEHYQTVLPAVFTLMHDNTPGVQERACYALDAFVENLEEEILPYMPQINLEEEILPYMPQIVEKLVEVLRTGSHTMQDVALSAIASTVAAAGKDFEPYVGTLLPILQHFMSTTSPELLPHRCLIKTEQNKTPALLHPSSGRLSQHTTSPELLSHRCHSTECAGLLIESLPEHPAVAPLIPAFMQLGLASFQPQATPSPAAAAAGPGSSEIREYSHGLFARVAKALHLFRSLFPDSLYRSARHGPWYLTQPLIANLCKEDVTFPSDGESQAEADGGADVSLTDDDEEEDDGGKMCVRTGVMDEKCAASMALGHYAQAVPAAFAPYLETALPALTNMMARPVNETSTVLATTLPLMVDMLEDEDKHVVTAAILAVSSLLTDIGPQAVGASFVKNVGESKPCWKYSSIMDRTSGHRTVEESMMKV